MSHLDMVENSQKRFSDRVQVFRSSILRAAFSGKLVPQDSQDEPASILLGRIPAERSASRSKSATRRLRQELAHA